MRQERTGLARRVAARRLGALMKWGEHIMDFYEVGFWTLLSYIIVREICLAAAWTS